MTPLYRTRSAEITAAFDWDDTLFALSELDTDAHRPFVYNTLGAPSELAHLLQTCDRRAAELLVAACACVSRVVIVTNASVAHVHACLDAWYPLTRDMLVRQRIPILSARPAEPLVHCTPGPWKLPHFDSLVFHQGIRHSILSFGDGDDEAESMRRLCAVRGLTCGLHIAMPVRPRAVELAQYLAEALAQLPIWVARLASKKSGFEDVELLETSFGRGAAEDPTPTPKTDSPQFSFAEAWQLCLSPPIPSPLLS